MIFHDGVRSYFPRRCLQDEEVQAAKSSDREMKNNRKDNYNTSRRTKSSNFEIGEQVLIRNFSKCSKYEPTFLPERFVVMDILANGKIVLVCSARTGKYYRRHPNDLKRFEGTIPDAPTNKILSEGETLQAWREAFEALDDRQEDEWVDSADDAGLHADQEVPPVAIRHSTRERIPNRRYYNDDFDSS